MCLSGKELNRRTLQLARRLVAKHTADKKNGNRTWKRSELIAEGYSGLVVNKVEQYDALDRCKNGAVIALSQMWIVFGGVGYFRWLSAFVIAVCAWDFVRYFKAKLSSAENAQIYGELTEKLGEFNEAWDERPVLESWDFQRGKRPLLWRLDAFLSGKRVSE